eukprot:4980899-Pyramimonas_sp.AAC.1
MGLATPRAGATGSCGQALRPTPAPGSAAVAARDAFDACGYAETARDNVFRDRRERFQEMLP